MLNILRYPTRRLVDRGPLAAPVVRVAVIAMALALPVSAQRGAGRAGSGDAAAPARTEHLNPAIAKLAAGQPIIGTNIASTELTMNTCHSLARMNYDYVYVDMEHGPLDMLGLANCVSWMVDKAYVLKTGSAAPKVALFARFPPYGRDLDSNDWIAKEALDLGLMGIIWNGVDNAEQAQKLVRFMRYPQQKTSKYQNPPGMRGYSPTNAVFAWGIPTDEYEKKADLYPLNPDGELLCIPMIETAEGLKNAASIAAVPGVGAIFIGAGGDLHQWLGVPTTDPAVEEARQSILRACKAQNVPCGITAGPKAEVDKRLAEGWKMIRTGSGGG